MCTATPHQHEQVCAPKVLTARTLPPFTYPSACHLYIYCMCHVVYFLNPFSPGNEGCLLHHCLLRGVEVECTLIQAQKLSNALSTVQIPILIDYLWWVYTHTHTRAEVERAKGYCVRSIRIQPQLCGDQYAENAEVNSRLACQ